jgi:hypothetical protein
MLCSLRALFVSVGLILVTSAGAATPHAFQFESTVSLDDMRHYIEAHFPPGTPRAALRKAFVDEGAATLKTHPTQAGVEKYLYDINLCGYYIWRWNISADFDSDGRALQVYVNGEPLYPNGPQLKNVKDFTGGTRQSIYKVMRPRPEASKGESQLAYTLFDADSDTRTIEDELAIGGGPTRADVLNMGTLHVYGNVDPWRSIFDKDDAARIVNAPGDCKAADELAARQKAAAQQPAGRQQPSTSQPAAPQPAGGQ